MARQTIPTWAWGLALVVSALLVLGVYALLHLEERFEGIEGRLGYRPPDEGPGAGPADEEPVLGSQTGTLYVPVYSHVYEGGGTPALMAITLTIHNVDPTSTVTIDAADYYDTNGHRVRAFLDGPRRLRPLQTLELLVEQADDRGGSGANFLVEWRAPAAAAPPHAEAVMVGNTGQGSVSLRSEGIEVRERAPPAEQRPEASPTPR